MEATNWESSSGGASSDDDNYEQDLKDEEECLFASGYLRKMQFRKHTSTVRWNDRMGMAEVVENKSSLWTTTGIEGCGKIYCSIEETLVNQKKLLEVFQAKARKWAMRGYPPSKKDTEVLERTSRGIPMKYCHVEHGRACFFSFDNLQLPILP